MASSISIQAFMNAARHQPIIDVRSPSEFAQGHIPGACNIPLFTDDERDEIGTLYKQKNRDAAFKRGLQIVGPKMRSFVEKSEEIAPRKEVLLHCWRGGMRSSSFGWLLKTAGFTVQMLDGGYKTYRNFVLEQFEQQKPVQILGGYTGSGKTEILKELDDLGEQVIDLEGLAHHKGSTFGHLGESPQPTGEQFQNRLGLAWYRLDSHQPVWLEDESRFVGHRIIPQPLYQQMRSAPVVRLEVSKQDRIERLVDDYGSFETDELQKSIETIRKRLGGLRTQQAIEDLKNGRLAEVARRILHYYDKAYDHGMEKRTADKITALDVRNKSTPKIAQKLIESITTNEMN